MMERQKGKFVVECDGAGCSEVLETDTGDFGTAREQMQEEAWKFRKVGSDWKHYCSKCKP